MVPACRSLWALLVVLSLLLSNRNVRGVEIDCCDQMGPSLGEVIDQADDWPEVYVCWSLCSLAIAGALVMYGRIVSAHIGTPSNSVRNLIIGIVTLIPVRH